MSIHTKLFSNTAIAKLVSISIAILISFSIIFILMYQILIPKLVTANIESHAQSITTFFADTILEHVVTRDYLSINKITETVSKLPDIGYACVINDKGNVIAGLFGNLKEFNAEFNSKVNENGFPLEIASQIDLTENKTSDTNLYQIGERAVIDYALRLDNANAEVHVGIFTENVIQNSQKLIIPYAFLLVITAIFGIIAFIWILGVA